MELPVPVSVCVIIVNWNGRHHLARCLPSLRTQTYRDFEIIVVDNGSNDGSVAWLETDHPDIRLIQNPYNLGFATANNQAIRATENPYVVTLNNDTEATATWVAELVAAVESDTAVGMVASQMLLAHTPEVIDSAGIEVDWTGTAWQRRRGEPADESSDPEEVFGPCAGAALYRRAMLEEAGLFDEDFFAYYEDVDLAWRARNADWRCLYAPRARVYHVHSATGGQEPTRKRYLIGRNKVWTLVKNYPAARLLVTWPLVLSFEMAVVFYSLLIERDSAPLRGRLAGWRELPRAWGKRRTGRRGAWGQLSPVRNPLRVRV
jgi:GT2 family glycosyltransferase